MRAGLAGVFGVLGENNKGRKVVEFCAEREPCVGNTYFKHCSLHKYTRMARGQEGVEVKMWCWERGICCDIFIERVNQNRTVAKELDKWKG